MKRIVVLFSVLFLFSCGNEYTAGTSSDVPIFASNSINPDSSAAVYIGDREGELLVKFKPNVRAASSQRIHQSIGARTLKRIPHADGLELVKVDQGVSSADAIRYYKSNPEVEYAEPNYKRRAAATPNDPDFGLQWGLTKISAPSAWDISTGSSVVVAVIDTGINYNHPDLSANIWSNPGEIPGNAIDDDGNGYVDDVRGWNFVSSNNSPMDDNEHGTHVAGIIGAVGNNLTGISGMIWSAKLMPLKILDSEGNGNISDEISAIYYAISKGAKVINFSLTGTEYSQSEYNAINAAKNAGVLVAAAAGNEGANNDITPSYPANYNIDNIISVASTNSSDSLSYFSNYGSSVHVAAPGSNIYSTVLSGYGYLSGTSMATPHVAGLAGLLLGYYPNYTYSQARLTILNYADILPSLSGRVQTSGRINAYLALSSVVSPSELSANPVSASQMQLNWTDRATGEDGYKIERRYGSDQYEQIASLQYQAIAALPSNSSSYTDTPPSDGTTYDYRVYAYNAISGASGGPVSTVSATLPLQPPSNLSASSSSSSQISLAWSDNSKAEGGYKIERKTGSGDFDEIASTTANAVSYVDSGLSPSTSYTYRIRAFNAAAGNSQYSNESTAATQASGSSGGGGGGGCSVMPAQQRQSDISLPGMLLLAAAALKFYRGGMKRAAVTLYIAFFIIAASAFASAAQRFNISKDGEIVSIRGESHVMFVKEKQWLPAVVSQELTSGDTLKTGNHGKLDVLFIDGIQIKVHHDTILVIKDTAKDKKGTILGLKAGEIWSRAKSIPNGLKIETPSATAAIRGTDWDMVVDEKGTSYLTVLNGNVELFNEYGSVKVDAGEQAKAEIGKPPVKMFLVSPKDRVQWIISYTIDLTKLIKFHSHKRQETISLLPSAKKEAEQNPEDLKAKLNLAGLLYDLSETSESLKLYDEILNRSPQNITAITYKGLILLAKGETDLAEQLFKQALKSAQTSDMINASIGLAGVYLHRNDINEAEKILIRMEHERSPVIGLALAQFHAYRGDFRKAVQICEQYAAEYTKDERFNMLAADFYLTMDEPDKTKETLNKALSINQNSSEAHALYGRYHYLAGRGKEAEKSFKKAVELDPKNADAVSEHGKLLMDKGEFEESLKTHDRAVQLNPNANSYLSRRGMLLNWLEDIKGAEKDYKKALDITSSDYQSLDGLGFLALKEGRTKEAIEYFNKASLLEPRFAEPHIFLAIAYYQQENIERALEELRLAELLDTKDPLPHIIAYLIHQDTYRPFEAIKEATLALELLPNLKSVSPVEATQKGTTNLGSALLGLGLTELATSYAEESFNQYDAGSYFFSSIKYEGNPFIYSSTMSQGFLLNPISIRYSDRYQDIIPSPQHNFTIRATLGSEDGAFYSKNKAVQQGYIRNPWEMVYLIDWENYENKGFRPNGYERSDFITYGLGGRPDYKNGFFIWGGFKSKTSGDPGTVSQPDLDDKNKETHHLLSAGYNYRLGSKNNILLNFDYNYLKARFSNADPLGSTGVANPALSFINRFGFEQARSFFEKGVYDVGMWNGVQFYAADSTGALFLEGLSPLGFPSAAVLDTNTVRSRASIAENMGYQFKHLVTIADNHDVSYGVEYVPTNMMKVKQTYSTTPTGAYIGFYDEVFPPGPFYAMGELAYGDSQDEWRYDSSIFLAYLNDRWRVCNSLIIEGGLAYEKFRSTNSINDGVFEYASLHPRIGLSWEMDKIHTIRAAFQKKLYPGAMLSFAPLSTAGLVFDWVQLIPGSTITDYQASLESRWSSRLFTSLNVERRDVKNSETIAGEKNTTYFVSAAVNTILTDRLGAFVRYKLADSENKDGLYIGKALPMLPRHAAGAGLVWVSPLYVKAMLSTYYIAGMYGDNENTYKLPDFWTTDFALTWETLKKHLMIKFEAKNILDNKYETKQGYPAAGRSAFVTVEYRF